MTKTPTSDSGAWKLIENLPDHVDYYLERWSDHMREAGYLQHTTAKRVDCIEALDEFLEPMLAHRDAGILTPEFSWLLGHEDEWGRFLIESARRHRMRGITADMFLGCFKTFIHSLVDVIEQMDSGTQRDKVEARRHVRMYGDALETLFVQDWTRTIPDLTEQQLDETNRLLTMEKCRFENILNATSDLIFVVNSDGLVTNVNEAVRSVASDDDILNVPVWEVLDLEGQSMEELLKYYPVGMTCELNPFAEESIYQMQIAPLSSVSLASDQHMIMLTNVTLHANQRETLERVVAQKTEALREEKEQLEEMNITLRNVLQSIEKERSQLFGEVSAKINTIVVPALDRIEHEDDAAIRKGYVTVVKDQITRLAPGVDNVDPLLLKLTHMETKVAQFIQSGHSSKDIAHSLNLSVETIQTHRKNIRRKLGLHGKSVSLYAHLKTLGLSA